MRRSGPDTFSDGQAATGDHGPGDPQTAEARIVTGLRATSQSITWIGMRSGTFRNHGIDASFPRLEVGGPESAAGLARQDWDFAQTGTLPIAESVLNGGDPVILARNTIPHDHIVLLARRDITRLGQLSGKTVGILTDAYSGQAGAIVRLAVEKAGAKAIYVGLGTYRNIHTALTAGEIDAGALPIDFCFLQRDAWTCLETQSMKVPSIFATTRRLIAERRGFVLRVLRGFIQTIHLFKTSPTVVTPLLAEFLQFVDRDAVERLRVHYASLFPQNPRPQLAGGLQDIRDVLSPRYGSARTLKESDIADPSLIAELEQEGFIGALEDGPSSAAGSPGPASP